MQVFNRLDTMPIDYRKLRIHLTASQRFDNVPTLLRVRIICVHWSGIEEEVLHSYISLLGVSKASAVFRYSRKFSPMVKKIPLPKEGFEIHLHDLGSFLTFARVVVPHSDVFRFYTRVYSDLDIEYYLGDREFAVEWWNWAYNGGYHSLRASSLTLQQMGVADERHIKKQRKIRENMALWAS